MAVQRLNRTDAASEKEMAKIKKQHDKQLSRLYSQEERIFALLAYIGPLFVFPLFMKQESNFCQYHGKQGLLLFAVEIVLFIGSFIPVLGTFFYWGILIILLLGAFFGIQNVLNEKEEPLPLIGKYADLDQ